MHAVRLSTVLLFFCAVAACKPGPKPVVGESPSHAAPQAPAAPAATTSSASGASVSGDPDALRCDQQIGKAAARRLVNRCLIVSPASHPPCNAANACEMIRDEIKRSCDLFGPDKPKECTG